MANHKNNGKNLFGKVKYNVEPKGNAIGEKLKANNIGKRLASNIKEKAVSAKDSVESSIFKENLILSIKRQIKELTSYSDQHKDHIVGNVAKKLIDELNAVANSIKNTEIKNIPMLFYGLTIEVADDNREKSLDENIQKRQLEDKILSNIYSLVSDFVTNTFFEINEYAKKHILDDPADSDDIVDIEE